MIAHQYPTPVVNYSRWVFLRAMLHRGWWLVTSLYLVVEAGLTPLQLVLLGTAQGVAVLVTEVPTGVVADYYSRKWSIVISHVLMGAAMVATSQVTTFEGVLLTQILWGIAWTFSSGADVAWLTDEVDDSTQIGKFLAIAARWELIGSAFGLTVLGVIAWQVSMSFAMALAGSLMFLLGFFVAIAFTENRHPGLQQQRLALWQTLCDGLSLAKANKVIMCVLSVTFLVSGADEVFNRLYVRHLIDLGMPSILDSMLWLTLLGILTLSVGALVLRAIQNSLHGDTAVRWLYAAGCGAGALGLALFASAPGYATAMAGYVLVAGIAWNVIRTLGVIRVNNHSHSNHRATVQSFMSFFENLGEISLGLTLAIVAQFAGIPIAFWVAALISLLAVGLIVKSR